LDLDTTPTGTGDTGKSSRLRTKEDEMKQHLRKVEQQTQEIDNATYQLNKKTNELAQKQDEILQKIVELNDSKTVGLQAALSKRNQSRSSNVSGPFSHYEESESDRYP
jgi:uncharacterized coiled-coil DUF342 family protein